MKKTKMKKTKMKITMEDNSFDYTKGYLYKEDIVKQIAWEAYMSRTTEKEFELIHRKSAKAEFEKWWNAQIAKHQIPNNSISDIVNEAEYLGGEQAWVHNQGNGTEIYDISKESFIEGAKTVIDILKGDYIIIQE